MSKVFLCILALLMFSLPGFVRAQHKGINFQAVIKKPDGTYPSASGLTVTLQILDPVTNCVLREEEHSSKNVSNGYLNLIIGDASATTPLGKNPSPVLSIPEVMDNGKQRTGLKCVDIHNNVVASNQTYIPSNVDRRVLRVRLNIQGDDVVADFNMRAVAFAVNSEMLNSKTDTDFVNVNNTKGVTQDNVESIFQRYTNLDAILNNYTKLNSLLGNTNGAGNNLGVNITGNAATATTANSLVGGVNSLLPAQTGNGGKYLKTDGTNVSWETAASSGGLTQVGINLPTSVFTNGADITANGQVSATFTNQNAKTFFAGPTSGSGVPSFRTLSTADVGSFDTDVDTRADARITAAKDTANGIAGLDASTKIPLALLPNDAVFSSSVKTGTLKLTGPSSNEIQIAAPTSGLTSYNIALPTAAGTAGQVLKIDSVSGADLNLKWEAVTSSGGTLTSVGLSLPSTVFDVANSPLAADGTISATLKNQNANVIFAGPSSGGAAAPGFRTLTASDIPSLGWNQMTGVLSSEQIASHTPSFIANGLVMTGATNVAEPLVLSPCVGVVKSTLATYSCAPLASTDLATDIIKTGHIENGAVTDAKISGTISSGKLPVASGTTDGIINQIAQSIKGVKTFIDNAIFNTITASGNITTSADLASTNMTASGVVSADRIKVANSSATCDGTTEGSLRYNTTKKKMEYCNGTDWTQISQGVIASLILGAPSSAIVKSGPVTFDVNYGSGVDTGTINLTPAHVTIAGTATAGCSVTGVAGGGITRTVTVNGCTGTGSVYITIAQGTANSTTGDAAPAAGPSASYLVDNTGPNAPTSLVLGSVPNNFTNSPTITYTAATDVGGSAIAKHQVQIKKTSDSSIVKAWADHVSGADISGLSLTFNTNYTVEVRAQDAVGNIGVVASAAWTTINDPCPTNYILVPALAGYTTQDFCVAQYEMKSSSGAKSQATGNPWVSINRDDSRTACTAIGGQYDLISNAQWQTIARNIETVASNWSSGTVGTGTLARGWAANTGYGDGWTNSAVAPSTDNNCLYNTGANTCAATGTHLYRRTHTLTNGKVIWDFGGNVWEWTRDNYADLGVNPAISAAWNELDTLSATNKVLFSSANGTWNSTQGLGRAYGSSAGAVLRGGTWSHGAAAGVFAVALSSAPSYANTNVGFRCVFVP
ncbi:SUMF1/EgtB/PvdO family nonheme iron enzyme [Bdellovibrio sp.]|uniref:SUMF1/EgtB/PvdO family nonheme iron enzyme n=1 Tax=Bdellovibrio sp. TaxID=28201 RepID=UPI0039E4CBC7